MDAPAVILILYRFRFIDPVSGKWVRSRNAARKEVIAAGFASYGLEEPPEMRVVPDSTELTSGHAQRPFAKGKGPDASLPPLPAFRSRDPAFRRLPVSGSVPCP